MLPKMSEWKRTGVLVLAGVLMFCLCAVHRITAQDESAIRNEFRNPAKKYRPMVRWWWPGDDVTSEEIAREVGILDAQGFGGAEIQPFVTLDPRTLSPETAARLNDFASPRFYGHVRTAIDAAKARGMWIDDTFGTGWPFGGGMAITPELSAIELRFSDTTVDGPKAFTDKLEIPQWKPGLLASMMLKGGMKPEWPAGWEQRFEARSKVVAVVAMRSVPQSADAKGKPRAPQMLDRGSVVVLTDRLKPDGSLDWQVPEGTWHLFVFRQIPTRQPVAGASGTGPQLVLDHLNKAAFAAHAARVGDPLVRAAGSDAGTSLRAIFCDSLELQQYVFWSDGFLDQFKKRRGYDLTPYLAILRQTGYNDFYFSHTGGLPLFDVADGDAIRADYWKTISELIFEGFYHPFDEWAKEHHLASRVQAHGAPADLLKLYGDASIPETEQLGGGNTVNFMKLASSSGYDYGRPIVSSESFVFRGNPYITTPESIKANADKLFVSGINEIIYHGFPYKYDDGTKGVGWFPFQGQFSSQVNETNPIWPFIGEVNAYITRMQYIVQQGQSDLQVAIFRSALNEDDTGPTPSTGPVHDPFPAIEDSLTGAGLSFGFVNDDVLEHSSARSGLLTTQGGGRYSALIVPRETNVSPELIPLLKAFAAAKLPIVFVGGTPGANVSFKSLEQDRERVATGLHELVHAQSAIAAANHTEATAKLAALIQPQVRFIAGDVLPFVKKTVGSTRFYLLTNPAAKAAHATVEFAESAAPERWNAWTGDVADVAFVRKAGHANLDVALPPRGSELVAFNDARRTKAEMRPVVTTEIKSQALGQAGWSVDATGDSAKGVGVAVHVKMDKLADWLDNTDLRTFSGTAVYTTHFVIAESDLKAAQHVLLDLGEVKDVATVKINGSGETALLVHPFSTDVRRQLHAGDNTIEISVTNSLTNYVSTLQWPKTQATAMMGHYPPASSGLLGPVTLRYEQSRTGLRGTL